MLGSARLVPIFHPVRSKPKPSADSSAQVFLCLASLAHVIALSFDWFTGFSVSFLIGWSDYFGFGFTLLN